MVTLKSRTLRALRSSVRSWPAANRLLKRMYIHERVETGPGFVHAMGRNYSVIAERRPSSDARVGIFLRGACDLPAIFGVATLLRPSVEGICAVYRDPILISGSRSDILLQALDGLSDGAESAAREVVERLRLPAAYFSPRLFAPTFAISRSREVQSFDKTVVVLSIAAEFSRKVYRHREHGFLVDPGGFWLSNSIEAAMDHADEVKWFSKTFESIGRLSVEDFRHSFGRLVREVQHRTGARVLVFNTLTITPHDLTHRYDVLKQSELFRRRGFVVALAEMSQGLDMDIIDVDRVLKLGGISEQVDFAHFTETQFAPIAAEAYRVLLQRGIFPHGNPLP